MSLILSQGNSPDRSYPAARGMIRSRARARTLSRICVSSDDSTGTASMRSNSFIAGTRWAGSLALQVLLQSRHQLNEIARAEAIVELVHEDFFPGVAAGAGRSRQRKQIGGAGDPGRGPALDRRSADLVVAEPAEQLAKTLYFFLIDAVKCFGRHIAPGDPGTAGRDHDVDLRIGDPGLELRHDLGLLVAHDAPRGDM